MRQTQAAGKREQENSTL